MVKNTAKQTLILPNKLFLNICVLFPFQSVPLLMNHRHRVCGSGGQIRQFRKYKRGTFLSTSKMHYISGHLNLGFDLANFRGESATYAPNKKRCYNRWFMSGRLLVLKKLKTHFILSPTMSKHCSQKLRPYNHRSKNGNSHSATYGKALHTASAAPCNPGSARM